MTLTPGNAYEAKQQRRRERLAAASDRSRSEAERSLRTAERILDVIPLGQPILVGHHSERRHRRDLAKANRAQQRGMAAWERADELARRAAAVGTAGISSDDPDAVTKLRAALEAARVTRQLEKATNAQLRRLAALRRKEHRIDTLTEEDRVAIVDQLELPEAVKDRLRSMARAWPWLPQFGTGTAAEIRRLEQRIVELEARAVTPEREPLVGAGWRVEENRAANRTQIWFQARPAPEVIARLKRAGFRWSPSGGVWQRHLSPGAWHAAQRVLQGGL